MYALTTYGYTRRISKSNSKKRSAKIKNETLNCVLFWPKKEWKPHSNVLSFSWYGLWGANKKLIAKNKIAIIGIKTKRK